MDIAGRHVEVTKALRQFAQTKLQKLEKLLDGPIEAHVVLGIEKHRHLCEIQVRSRTALLSGQAETEDLYASIGDVADKLERQALKHKEKRKERKKRTARRADAPARAPARAKAASPSRKAAASAVAAVESSPRIVRSSRYRLKPLTPEDALLELEASGEELLVFRDAETYRVNVVYRLADGSFAHVDPEF